MELSPWQPVITEVAKALRRLSKPRPLPLITESSPVHVGAAYEGLINVFMADQHDTVGMTLAVAAAEKLRDSLTAALSKPVPKRAKQPSGKSP